MENMSHDLPFFSLTLLHFGPTWEGMFWLPDLKKDIIRNGERLHIFQNYDSPEQQSRFQTLNLD